MKEAELPPLPQRIKNSKSAPTQSKSRGGKASKQLGAKPKDPPKEESRWPVTEAQRRQIDFPLTDKLIDQIKRLCQFGATDSEICDFFGINTNHLYTYKLAFPELAAAMSAGKVCADTRVERSLYARAIGFRHKAIKIFYDQQTGRCVEHEYEEVHPPETGACIFWLKNRKPDVWKDAFAGSVLPPDEQAKVAQEALAKLMAVTGSPDIIEVQAKERK